VGLVWLSWPWLVLSECGCIINPKQREQHNVTKKETQKTGKRRLRVDECAINAPTGGNRQPHTAQEERFDDDCGSFAVLGHMSEMDDSTAAMSSAATEQTAPPPPDWQHAAERLSGSSPSK